MRNTIHYNGGENGKCGWARETDATFDELAPARAYVELTL